MAELPKENRVVSGFFIGVQQDEIFKGCKVPFPNTLGTVVNLKERRK
jgi:hypothetical protein